MTSSLSVNMLHTKSQNKINCDNQKACKIEVSKFYPKKKKIKKRKQTNERKQNKPIKVHTAKRNTYGSISGYL